MQIFVNTQEIHKAGKTLCISKYLNKFAKSPLYRVTYKRGSFWYVLKDGLLNKPNSRQIARYFEMI